MAFGRYLLPLAAADGYPLTVNPYGTSESFNIIKQFGDGTLRMGVPRIGFGVVDVRDLAEAHYRAGFTPAAHGRYIVSGHNSDLADLAVPLREKATPRTEGARFKRVLNTTREELAHHYVTHSSMLCEGYEIDGPGARGSFFAASE